MEKLMRQWKGGGHNFWKNLLDKLIDICAIVPLTKQFRYKRRNLSGLNLG
jgi:hypothetical protein